MKKEYKIAELEKEYSQECEEIAQECEKEGYPAHGSNYEIRCEESRKYYDREIEKISCEHTEESAQNGIELLNYSEFWKEFEKMHGSVQ